MEVMSLIPTEGSAIQEKLWIWNAYYFKFIIMINLGDNSDEEWYAYIVWCLFF